MAERITLARFVQICSNPFSLDQQRHLIIEIEKENLEEFSTNLKSLLLARRNCEKDGEGMERGRKGPKRI